MRGRDALPFSSVYAFENVSKAQIAFGLCEREKSPGWRFFEVPLTVERNKIPVLTNGTSKAQNSVSNDKSAGTDSGADGA